MKYLLIILAVVSLLFSCEKDVYFYIPKNENPLLKDSDTVVFIDRKNNYLDSFLIKRLESYNVSDKRYYQEVITIQYNKVNKSSSIAKILTEQMASTNIYIDGYYFPTIYKPASHDYYNTININVSGVNYSTVFVLHNNSCPDSIPNTVYYTHKYGIIRYDFSDGRYYELNSKIH